MRTLIQRVSTANVQVEQKVIGSIEKGFLVLFGVHVDDTREPIAYLAEKLINLRVFEDDAGKMNKSLLDVKGDLLIVSQFTLYADTSQGRRPSFLQSARPDKAKSLYEEFLLELKRQLRNHETKIETGMFGAHMEVSLLNDGPVTILLEK